MPDTQAPDEMPHLTSADASLVLDHVMGDLDIPNAVAHALLAALPFPSEPSARFRRAVLLRRLAADPVSSSSLDSLQLLSSLSSSPLAAAAHLAVAAYLAASAADFDAAAAALFAQPSGRARRALEHAASGLASPEAAAAADQFEAAVGNAFSQAVLRGMWGDRVMAEAKVMELVDSEWVALGQSRLERMAERIAGERAVETWRNADEETRAKYRVLVGKAKTHEILIGLGESTSHLKLMPTPAVDKMMNALKSSCADLRSSVEDPLPHAMKTADEVLNTRMTKGVDLNAQEVTSQLAACDAAGPSVGNDKGTDPMKGTSRSLMDWNPTAQRYQWGESNEPDSEGSQAPLPRPRLPTPRRTAVSPLKLAENKSMRRKPRKWSSLEEETLRNAVRQFGSGSWKNILANNPEVFVGRTAVDLKDKWRNMSRH